MRKIDGFVYFSIQGFPIFMFLTHHRGGKDTFFLECLFFINDYYNI